MGIERFGGGIPDEQNSQETSNPATDPEQEVIFDPQKHVLTKDGTGFITKEAEKTEDLANWKAILQNERAEKMGNNEEVKTTTKEDILYDQAKTEDLERNSGFIPNKHVVTRDRNNNINGFITQSAASNDEIAESTAERENERRPLLNKLQDVLPKKLTDKFATKDYFPPDTAMDVIEKQAREENSVRKQLKYEQEESEKTYKTAKKEHDGPNFN